MTIGLQITMSSQKKKKIKTHLKFILLRLLCGMFMNVLHFSE